MVFVLRFLFGDFVAFSLLSIFLRFSCFFLFVFPLYFSLYAHTHFKCIEISLDLSKANCANISFHNFFSSVALCRSSGYCGALMHIFNNQIAFFVFILSLKTKTIVTCSIEQSKHIICVFYWISKYWKICHENIMNTKSSILLSGLLIMIVVLSYPGDWVLVNMYFDYGA